MRPLNSISTEGVETIRSPHRAWVALAGSAVVLIAVTAFNLGLNSEWKRPLPQLGSPLVAVDAVALSAEQLAAMNPAPAAAIEPAARPVRQAVLISPKVSEPAPETRPPRPYPAAVAASVQPAVAIPPVRDAVMIEPGAPPADDPVGPILAAPY